MKIQIFKVPAVYFNHQLSLDLENKVFQGDESVAGQSGADIMAHTTTISQFNNGEMVMARKIAEDTLTALSKKHNFNPHLEMKGNRMETEESFMERVIGKGLKEEDVKVKTHILQKILVK